MPVTNADTTYTNGNSGRTRVNAQGLIVGVDLSTTSNTIATGAKTFTLTATANVNRDWQVGSSVVAVTQAGATGSMIGTVTSYTPSTQSLVLNITSITGSGTSTDWRIGSTMLRDLVGAFDYRDFDPVTLAPKGGLVEGGATCLTLNNQDMSTYSVLNGTNTIATETAPNGFSKFYTLTDTNAADYGHVFKSSGSLPAGRYTLQVFVKKQNTVFGLQAGNPVSPSGVYFDALTGQRVLTYNPNPAVIDRVFDFGAFWFVQTVLDLPAGAYGAFLYANPLNAGRTNISSVNTDSITYFGLSLISGDATSFIPTTTVSVTRAADQLSIGGTNFSQFYNSAQGTLVMELTPIAAAVGAVAGSLNDGTLNNAIRIGQRQTGTQSSIRKMATDGVTHVMAVNAAPGNTLRSSGVDYDVVPLQADVLAFGAATSSVGNFLVAGASEIIRNSADSGLTYNNRGVGTGFGGAHFGIGRFVLAGSTSVINGATVGCVVVSSNGEAFRRVNIPGLTQNLTKIASNGTNQYVAVGIAGVIYTSPDAETWTARTSGTVSNLVAAHFFGGRYVAISSAANATRYSDNGVDWLATTGLTIGAQDVHHNGTNLWVAVAAGGNIYASPDGITWTQRTSPVTATLNGIYFADGLWVAVGVTGTVVTSPDGTTWTDRTATAGVSGANLNEVNFFGGKFYAVGTNTAFENTAANIVAGVAWTTRGANLVGVVLGGIATNGTRLLMCGSAGGIATSEDGITFTSRTGNAAQLNGAAFGGGTYVVVGNAINGSGLIATVNPTTFEYQRRSPVFGANNIFDVIRSGSRFIIAAATNRMGYSDDNGVTWVSVEPQVNVATDFLSLATDGVTVVSVGQGGRLIVSANNGTTWSAYNAATTVGTTQQQNGVSWANGLFVSVGNGGTISTSPTGAIGSWTLRTSSVTSNLFSVMYSTRDSMWFAAGDNGVILRAADPTGTWTSISNDATVGIFTAGVLQANPIAGKFIPNVKNRVAISWDATTGVNISINGGDVVSDPSVTMPVLTQYTIGMNGVSGSHWNSTIKTQKAYRVKVSNSELKALARI